jgi:hypothetical protein
MNKMKSYLEEVPLFILGGHTYRSGEQFRKAFPHLKLLGFNQQVNHQLWLYKDYRKKVHTFCVRYLRSQTQATACFS